MREPQLEPVHIKKSPEEFYRALRSDPHIHSIRNSTYPHYHQLIEQYNGDPRARQSLQLLLKILEGPLIRDDFGNNNNARRAWRREKEANDPEFNELYALSKLRMGTISAGLFALTALKQFGIAALQEKPLSQQFEELHTIIAPPEDSGKNPYKDLADEEKIALVAKEDHIIKSLFNALRQTQRLPAAA